MMMMATMMMMMISSSFLPHSFALLNDIKKERERKFETHPLIVKKKIYSVLPFFSAIKQSFNHKKVSSTAINKSCEKLCPSPSSSTSSASSPTSMLKVCSDSSIKLNGILRKSSSITLTGSSPLSSSCPRDSSGIENHSDAESLEPLSRSRAVSFGDVNTIPADSPGPCDNDEFNDNSSSNNKHIENPTKIIVKDRPNSGKILYRRDTPRFFVENNEISIDDVVENLQLKTNTAVNGKNGKLAKCSPEFHQVINEMARSGIN